MVCTVLDFSEPNRTAKKNFGTGTEPNRRKNFQNRTEPNRQKNFWNRNRTEPSKNFLEPNRTEPSKKILNWNRTEPPKSQYFSSEIDIFSILCRKSPKICSRTEPNREPSDSFLEPEPNRTVEKFSGTEPNRTAKKFSGTGTEPNRQKNFWNRANRTAGSVRNGSVRFKTGPCTPLTIFEF